MFPFETTDKHYVRADMRRDDRSTKGTGTFSGFLVTKLAGPGDTTIARLDRKVLWALNNGRKEYTECPVQGCPVPPREEKAAKPEDRREEPKQKTEEGCVTRIANTNFEVKPTGQKRELNGFNADQYQATWVVLMQDKEMRSSMSTVKFDIWTTPVSAQMRQAFDTEAAFGRAYAANVRTASAAKAAERAVVPPEMMSMMTGYLGSLSDADRAKFTRAVSELQKIKGHPVSTKVEWFLEGNACGAKEEQAKPAASSTPSLSMGSLISGLSGMMAKKEEPAGPKPLMSFSVEVKQLGVQPLRDSVFLVPASYKLISKAN